jgi:hypothetical protein
MSARKVESLALRGMIGSDFSVIVAAQRLAARGVLPEGLR